MGVFWSRGAERARHVFAGVCRARLNKVSTGVERSWRAHLPLVHEEGQATLKPHSLARVKIHPQDSWRSGVESAIPDKPLAMPSTWPRRLAGGHPMGGWHERLEPLYIIFLSPLPRLSLSSPTPFSSPSSSPSKTSIPRVHSNYHTPTL